MRPPFLSHKAKGFLYDLLDLELISTHTQDFPVARYSGSQKWEFHPELIDEAKAWSA
jgi:hypothetical protein